RTLLNTGMSPLQSLTSVCSLVFFFRGTAATEFFTLSLHDALPICDDLRLRVLTLLDRQRLRLKVHVCQVAAAAAARHAAAARIEDRKSTRLNSSHRTISYAVFCLKKKKPISAPICHSPPTPPLASP